MPIPGADVYAIVKDVTEDLIKIADLSARIDKRNSERAQRISGVLASIVRCLDSIAAFARAGRVDACRGACEELGIYLQNFASIDGLPELAGASNSELTRTLWVASNARYRLRLEELALSSRGSSSLDSIVEIERAAGRFRAAVALVKGEIVAPKRRRRALLVRFAIGALLAALAATFVYGIRVLEKPATWRPSTNVGAIK